MLQKAASKQEMLSSIKSKFLSIVAHDVLTSNEHLTDPYTFFAALPYTAKSVLRT